MKNTLNWLSGLLALQLVVAGAIYVGMQSASAVPESRPLLAFQPGAVDKIVLSDGEQEIELVRREGQWQLPGLQDLPVDAAKLDRALARLAELTTTWPVTTSTSSHDRLEVAPDNFIRRISLYTGHTLLDQLFLGTSPGFKQVYSRPAADDKVYSLALNSYEYPVSAFDWLDKGLLEVKNAQVIQEHDLKLVKSKSGWNLDGSGTDAAPDQTPIELDDDKVAPIIETLSTLKVAGVADKAPDFAAADTVSLKVKGDGDWTFHLLNSEGRNYIRRDDIDATFLIGQREFDKLTGMRKDLLASNSKAAPQQPNSGEVPTQTETESTTGG